MGFVKVTDREGGKVVYDSRRDELDEEQLAYIHKLEELKENNPKLAHRFDQLIESATRAEYDHALEKQISRHLKLPPPPSRGE